MRAILGDVRRHLHDRDRQVQTVWFARFGGLRESHAHLRFVSPLIGAIDGSAARSQPVLLIVIVLWEQAALRGVVGSSSVGGDGGTRSRRASANAESPSRSAVSPTADYPPTTAVAPATMTPRETRKTAMVRSKMEKRRETDMTRHPCFFTENPRNRRGLSDLDNA